MIELVVKSFYEYVASLFYLCKTEIYNSHLRVCSFINKNKISEEPEPQEYTMGECNCITQKICEDICKYIKEENADIDFGEFSGSALPCGAYFANIDQHNKFLRICFMQALSDAGEENQRKAYQTLNFFKEIKPQIDILICFLALTNGNPNYSDKTEGNNKNLLKFLLHSPKELVRTIDNTIGTRNSIETITLPDNSEISPDKLLLIFDCCEILNQLNDKGKIISQRYSVSVVLNEEKVEVIHKRKVVKKRQKKTEE